MISKTYGFSHSYFKNILSENGVEYIDRAKIPKNSHREKLLKIEDELISAYQKTGKLSYFSDKLKIPYHALREFLEDRGVFYNTNQILDQKKLEELKDSIYTEYVKNRKNISDISRILKITRYNARKTLVMFYGEAVLREKSAIIRDMNYRAEHQENARKGQFKKKSYKLPSGKVIKLQGYEDDFLEYVFKNTTLTEEDFGFNKVFRIELSKYKSKHKHYYPDFFLRKYNTTVEIKSKYIAKLNPYLHNRKIQKTKELGYNHIVIYDKDYASFEVFLKTHNLLK